MSLQIQHLTKLYGKQRAINSISFSVKKGEIVGFLGPNGAGKSTTMKIITGYLSPSEGRVTVDDLDVAEKSLEVKRITGYLPEHNPLYLDMYVHEYLHFIGGLYGISGHTRKRCVVEIIERCGLIPEQGKKLGALSKGYRQRVGLAQALIHNPRILILDEPTSGLDPNQIVEIRKMIKTISKDKTVLFSTHIMQEAQALCDRVVIINRGEIVADDYISTLIQNSKYSSALIVSFKGKVNLEELSNIRDVKNVTQINSNQFKFFAHSNVDLKDSLFRYATEKKYILTELREEKNEMEKVFQELTSDTVYD